MIPLARTALAAAVPLALAATASAQTVDRLSATLTGFEENPPVASPAHGLADLTFDAATATLSCVVTSDLATADAAHIHDGPVGVNGGVVVPLGATGSGDFSGSAVIGSAVLTDLFREGLYVNLHSPAAPGGEIRGQIRVPTQYRGNLSGAKEVPPNPSAATGTVHMVLNQPAGTLTYQVEVNGMVATAAHIHRGTVGVNGPIVFPLTQVGPGAFAGTTAPLSNSDFVDLLTGGFYVNVHSGAFPGGEVRDQLRVGGLNVDVTAFGAANGTETRFFVDALPELAGKVYLVLGSASGTAPGFVVDGVQLPLNPDNYSLFTLSAANGPALPMTLGVTDPDGSGVGRIRAPAGAAAVLAGVVLQHAFVVFDPLLGVVVHASNAQPLAVL